MTEVFLVCLGRLGISEEDHRRIEQAMVEAGRQAQREGITDPILIRERIKKAREAAL